MLCLLIVTSCDHRKQLGYGGLSKEYYSELACEELATNSMHVRDEIAGIAKTDPDTADADSYTRAYYRKGGQFLWIDRHGVKANADTLLAYLDTMDAEGFNTARVKPQLIRENIERVRGLAFGETDVDVINETLASVEYYLTKAFLRYGVGMRYGVTNPAALLNELDAKDDDTLHVTYRQLFDVKMHSAGRKAYSAALQQVAADSLGAFLKDARPKNPLYHELKAKLPRASGAARNRILVNMERARWRTHDAPYMHKEYVLVNVAACRLWAVNEDSVMDMRIGCGALKTKTPLLHSAITHMEINPQWVIPHSIVKKDITAHGGDGDYFNRRNYFAQHKKSGKRLYGSDITYDVIASGEYFIIQQGGEGNSLGRIIFRFPNDFAVYLHDTSSRGVFEREQRSVSHGCIRVQRPYDLACFLLRGKDQEKAERIRMAMEETPENGKKAKSFSAKVDPTVPVYITYYTLFVTPNGNLEAYNDIYGYDKVLMSKLRDYCTMD